MKMESKAKLLAIIGILTSILIISLVLSATTTPTPKFKINNESFKNGDYTNDTTPQIGFDITPSNDNLNNNNEGFSIKTVTLKIQREGGNPISHTKEYDTGDSTIDMTRHFRHNITTALTEGNYKINLTVLERYHGNTFNPITTKHFYNFNIDTTEPTITLINPPENNFVTKSQSNIKFSVTDAGSFDKDGVKLYIGSSTRTRAVTQSGSGDTKTYTSSSTTSTFGSSGIYSFRISVTDDAGNNINKHYSLEIDKTKPIISNVVSNNSFTSQSIPQVSFDIIERNLNETVIFFNGEATDLRGQGTRTGDTTSFPLSPISSSDLTDGTYSFNIFADDTLGNEINSTHSFTIDTIKPNVYSLSLTATDYSTDPRANPLIKDNTPTIKFKANDTNLQSVKLEVEGKFINLTGTGTGSGTAKSYSHTITNPLTDGEKTITIHATDKAGNTNSSEKITFDLDATKPKIADVIPADNELTNDNTRTISFTVQDVNIDDVDDVQLFFNGIRRELAVCSDWDDVCQFTFTPETTLADGEHTFKIDVRDNLGNRFYKTYDFEVDATEPVISVISPIEFTNDDTPTISFSVIDENLDSNSVVFTLNNIPRSRLTKKGNIYSYDAPKLNPSQTHTFIIDATDTLTNQKVVSKSFKIDTIKPTIASVSHNNTKTNNKKPTITFVTSDNSNQAMGTVTLNIGGSNHELPILTNNSYSYTYPTELRDGSHSFTISITDKAGNPYSEKFTFSLKTRKLSNPIQNPTPANNSIISDTTPTIKFRVPKTDLASFELEFGEKNSMSNKTDDLEKVSSTSKVYDYYTYTPIPLRDGKTYHFNLSVSDVYGNSLTKSQQFSIKIDPVIHSLKPADKTITNNNRPTITFNAILVEDNDDTKISINGINHTLTGQGSGLNKNYTYTFNKSDSSDKLKEGNNTITIYATDGNGDTSTLTHNLFIDSRSPSISGVSPSDKSEVKLPIIEFSLTDASINNPKTKVKVETDGTSNRTIRGTKSSDNKRKYTLSYPNFQDGTHTFRVYANDSLGNFYKSKEYTFHLDKQNPTIEITSPTNKSVTENPSPEILFNIKDKSAELNYTILVNDKPSSIGTTTPNTEVKHTLSNIGYGKHTIKIQAQDKVGNIGISNTIEVRIVKQSSSKTSTSKVSGTDSGVSISTRSTAPETTTFTKTSVTPPSRSTETPSIPSDETDTTIIPEEIEETFKLWGSFWTMLFLGGTIVLILTMFLLLIFKRRRN